MFCTINCYSQNIALVKAIKEENNGRQTLNVVKTTNRQIYLEDYIDAILDIITSNSEYLHRFDHFFQNVFQVFPIQLCELLGPMKGN